MKLSRMILAAIIVISFSQSPASAGKFGEMMERLKSPLKGQSFLPKFKLVVHEYEEFTTSGQSTTSSNEVVTVAGDCCVAKEGCLQDQSCRSHKGCDYCDGSGCSICDIRVNERLQKKRAKKGQSYYPSRAPICESNFGFYHTCWRKLAPIPSACREDSGSQSLPQKAEPKKVFHLPTERSAERPNRTNTIPVFDAERMKRESQTLEYYPPKTVSGVREK